MPPSRPCSPATTEAKCLGQHGLYLTRREPLTRLWSCYGGKQLPVHILWRGVPVHFLEDLEFVLVPCKFAIHVFVGQNLSLVLAARPAKPRMPQHAAHNCADTSQKMGPARRKPQEDLAKKLVAIFDRRFLVKHAAIDGCAAKLLLVRRSLDDILFDGVGASEPQHAHFARLPDSVRSVLSLKERTGQPSHSQGAR